MTVLAGATLSELGIDGAALKPAEMDLERAYDLDVDLLAIDYEGKEYLPERGTLRDLAAGFDLRVTVPVRADGFDPHGDDSRRSSLPDAVSEVLVAGNGAYLDDHERKRAVAPRLAAAVDSAGDPWVGTEGIERLALAVGGTQFELLSRNTTRSVRALRETGFDEDIAVYAPTVLTDETAAILDAVGPYAARRGRVEDRLPDGSPTDDRASGTAREILERACEGFALVGTPERVAERVSDLHDAGVDHVVSYPARGLDPSPHET